MRLTITKKQAKSYLLRYHHLCDETAILSEDGIVDYVRHIGCIQYDPLDVVGRNPDLALQARCPAYRKGDIEKLLYQDRRLFDVWDKNMSICAVEDWPYFSRYRRRFSPQMEALGDAVKTITEYLREHESACSSDFDFAGKFPWHYGPQRTAKAALECMCYCGFALVHHKKGSRRYYALAEKHIPKKFYAAADPNQDDDDYYAWAVLRRINSVGFLWNRRSDAWLGIQDFKTEQRERGFKKLLERDAIIPFTVEGMAETFYLDRRNVPLLQSAIEKPGIKKGLRFLAPLDNLLWDRRLIAALFDFEYTWEVYVPAEKRKYGYYVLPVLLGDRFIGRIEMKTDKDAKALVVQSFWPEPQCSSGSNLKHLKKGLRQFAWYNRCDEVVNK
jgi:uncharacterized protein YcaQ